MSQALFSVHKMRPADVDSKSLSRIQGSGQQTQTTRHTALRRCLCSSFPPWSSVFSSVKRERSGPRGRIARGKGTEHWPKAGTQRACSEHELLGAITSVTVVLLTPNLGL